MIRIGKKSLTNLLAFAIVVAILALWIQWLEVSLSRSAHSTGYLLYGSLLFLALYNLRKKLPGLPLGNSAIWLRLHLIIAWATLPLFLWHVSFRLPDGWIESTLTLLYAGTFASGIVGWYLSRTIPKQLSRTGEQFIFERIPRLRFSVRQEARQTVLRAVGETGSTTLASFYVDRLHGFFQRPRSFKYIVYPTSSTRQRLFSELDGIRRFLTEQEKQASEQLYRLIRKKDDLDFHDSRQRVLKIWLFIHIGLTSALIVTGTLHGIMALAYQGGPT